MVIDSGVIRSSPVQAAKRPGDPGLFGTEFILSRIAFLTLLSGRIRMIIVYLSQMKVFHIL